MERSSNRDSGFALILSLLVVAVVVSVTLHLNASVRSSGHGAANFRDRSSLSAVAASGVHLAMAVLYQDALSSDVDHDGEIWSDPERLSSSLSGLFQETACRLEVVDHSARIQVNKLVDEEGNTDPVRRAVLERLLSQNAFGLDRREVDNLLDALKDWLDPDDEITRFGAESGAYLSRDPPYACRNGPMASLDELLLVRGVTPDLFYGEGGNPGLALFLTVYGDGRVNINTAGPIVLRALSEDMTPAAANRMVAARRRGGEFLADPQWYRTVPGLGEAALPSGCIATASTHFEAVSEAGMERLSCRVSAVLERAPGGIAVLAWKAE